LAALGEVPPAETQEFRRHLDRCQECAQSYSDYVRLGAHLLRSNHDHEAVIEAHREPARIAVLESVRELQATPAPEPARHSFRPKRSSVGGAGIAWAGSAAAMVIASTFWFGARYEHGKLAQTPQNPARVVIVPAPAPAQPSVAPDASLQLENEQLTNALNSEKRQTSDLQERLAQKDLELRLNQQGRAALEQQIEERSKQLSDTQSLLAAKTTELAQLQNSKSSDNATLVALRYQVQDLTEKLSSQNENLKRERDLLSSGREIRDIIGARNLHIVDVYDTDTQGHTKRPFARAFYTEGKSLVFYAYDLPQHKILSEKYRYVAWGQSNGNKSSVRNLGILINDDQSQKRWMLKFSDPNVLAEIDSVFITLESADNGLDKPSGKRMLTAYLDDQVNHP